MKKDGVIFKDFGFTTTDRENRDESLKAYVCANMDVPSSEFDDILKGITDEKNYNAFINMLCNDMKGRMERIFEEQK